MTTPVLYNASIPNLYTTTFNIPSRGSAVPAMFYRANSKKAAFHFNGEGETTGPVSQGLKNSLLGLISATWQPDFSIFWIQGFGWATPAEQNEAYAEMKTLLGFTQVVLIGLSEGAWRATVILTAGASNPIAADTVAFVCQSTQGNDSVNKPAVAPIVSLGIAVLGSGDAGPDSTVDGHAQDDQKFIGYLQAANPKGNYLFVNTLGTGHGGWTQDDNPTKPFVNGLTVEQWFEQYYSTGTVTAPPVTTPPVVTPPTTTAPRKVVSVALKTVVTVTYDDGNTDTFNE